MATQKPKIQGYIEQATFDRFEAYRQESNLSQSQALEKIIASFFGGGRIPQRDVEDYYSLKMEWEYTRHELENLQKRVFALEAKSNPLSNPLEITSDLPEEITSDSPSNPLEITSELPSNLPEITSELPSNPLEITSDSPEEITSELLSNPLEITSELPEKITSESPSNPLSESLEITSNPLSNPLEITSEPPKLVVCKLYKNNPNDPQFWRYWAGAKIGFVEDLSKAKTYTEKGSSKVINQLLEDEIHKPTSRERISCRALEELTALVGKTEITSESRSNLTHQSLEVINA